MQQGVNIIRPASGEGNGVWISTTAPAPQPPQAALYRPTTKTVLKKNKKSRLERLLILSSVVIFILFIGLCVAIYLIADLEEQNNVCFAPECVQAAAILLDSINPKINPCDDFYTYACGNWRKSHPSLKPFLLNTWFQESSKALDRDIIDYLLKKNSHSEPRSVHDARLMYKTCLDLETMEEFGLETFWNLLDSLGLPRSPRFETNYVQPWIRTLGKIRRYVAMDMFIGSGVLPSMFNSTLNQIVVGFPEESEIIPGSRHKWKWEDKIIHERFKRKLMEEDADDPLENTFKKYSMKMIEYVFKAANNETEISSDEFEIAAYKILGIQRELLMLENNYEEEVSGNSEEIETQMTLETLQYILDNATEEGVSKIVLKDFFEAIYEDISDARIEFDSEELIRVKDIEYLEGLAKLIENTDDKTIELYMWWKVIYALAPHINEDLKELKEAFIRKVIGEISASSREIICKDTVVLLMSSAVGYQVMEYENHKPLAQIKDMITNVRNAFANFVFALDWMDDVTKQATVEKLYKMNMYVGYPNWYKQFELMDNLFRNITLTNSTHLQNILNLLNEEILDEFAAIDYINNSSRDFFDPLDVNAYYDPSSNSITVPYGIIQKPFYHLGLEALNYGAIGSILGHEITHGLDNTGRMYDLYGNFRTWWSNYSSEEYMKRETCFEDYYNKFNMSSVDASVNGATTLGENIADDGGIRDAFAAYQSYVKKHGKEAKLPGFLNFTHEQLFFISFANVWCAEYSEEGLLRTLQEDEHSPSFVRVIAVLQNFQEFAKSWNCPIGSYMNPDKKCKLWS